jgi:hypothetical protein
MSYPLHLPSGGKLRKNKHTTIIRTLKNGGLGQLKTPK